MLQNAVDYVKKIKREFLFVKGIQQTELDTLMSIDVAARNDPMS